MTQSPVTVTYSLEEVLTRIEGKIDELKKEVTDLRVGQTRLEEKLTGEIKTLDAKIEGMGKRLDQGLNYRFF